MEMLTHLKNKIYSASLKLVSVMTVQDVQIDKANKVMNDIVSTMFNKKFIDQIFNKHQPLYSRSKFFSLSYGNVRTE